MENIWWERPFWMDEMDGSNSRFIDGYLMTGSLGSQPTTILGKMDNRGTWSHRRRTTSIHTDHDETVNRKLRSSSNVYLGF